MKFSRSDLFLVRWNVLAICVSAIIGTIALYGSGEYAQASQTRLHNAQRTLNETRNRLVTAYQDQINMEAYAHEYGVLSERGIIGEDQRLDWMEGLLKIRQQNLVTDFHFNIAPQKPYTLQAPLDSGSFDIRYSEMKLQFDLLHEAQLPVFFDALRGQIKGWYQPEGCTLRRGSSVAPANLTAECSGGWITLKNRNVQ